MSRAAGSRPAFRAALMSTILAAAMLTASATPAMADPSADDWARLRMCESSGNYAINTGNGYYGAYQFNVGTWEWMGGVGLPSDASPAEQDYRALKLYRINGWAPWPGCTKKLALVNDADAKSKVIPPDPGFAPPPPAAEPTPPPAPDAADAAQPATPAKKKKKKKPAAQQPAPPVDGTADRTPNQVKKKTPAAATGSPETPPAATDTTQPDAAPNAGAATIPPISPKKKRKKLRVAAVGAAADAADQQVRAEPWPGRQYLPGEYSNDLKVWQQRAAALGYDVVPTGYFGPKTERIVRKIQDLHGVPRISAIGPETWAAAWATP